MTIPILLPRIWGSPFGTGTSVTDESGRKKMIGSLMFYEAESIEEVRKIVESDIYYTSGVVRLSLFPAHSPTNVTLRHSGTGTMLSSHLLYRRCTGRRHRSYEVVGTIAYHASHPHCKFIILLGLREHFCLVSNRYLREQFHNKLGPIVLTDEIEKPVLTKVDLWRSKSVVRSCECIIPKIIPASLYSHLKLWEFVPRSPRPLAHTNFTPTTTRSVAHLREAEENRLPVSCPLSL